MTYSVLAAMCIRWKTVHLQCRISFLGNTLRHHHQRPSKTTTKHKSRIIQIQMCSTLCGLLRKVKFPSCYNNKKQFYLVACCEFIITSAKEVMFLPDFVCLSVSQQDNSKSYGQIFPKFWGHVGNGKNYQWFNFGGGMRAIWLLSS